MTDDQTEDQDIDFDVDLDEIDVENDEDLYALKPGESEMIFDESHSGEGVLIYNGRKYAVGVVWLMADEDADPGFIYKRSKMLSADFFCTRSFVSQSGFGFLSKGHRMGMPSAAAQFADALVGEWHGVFSAENGWYYVAVHADAIAPDGDQFFESEEEAYNFFLSRADSYQWPKTYVPEVWNIKNNDGEISLDRLLDDVPTTSLKPANLDAVFSGKRNKSLTFIGIIFLIGLIFLSFFAQTLLPSLVPEQQKIAGPVVEVADFLSAPPKAPEEKENPLLMVIEKFALPKPSGFVDECVNGFGDLAISLPGWNLSTMRCRNTLVEAVWQKETGTLESIKAYADQFPFGVNRTYGARGDFLASRVLGNLSSYNEKIKLADREQILLAVNSRFGKIGRLAVKDIVPLADQIQRGSNVRGARRLASRNKKDGDKDRAMTIQDLPSLSIVFNTESAPMLLQGYFNIPGLRFNFIEWNVYNRRWIYDMQIYLLPQDAPSREKLR
ncbi:MAG: hypothetical protein COB76_00300 [Alphaproteobacteria bacterium]|nr:MAG: hypothetical protein COB76_00300 [Alphaproteobacteria bacterium]